MTDPQKNPTKKEEENGGKLGCIGGGIAGAILGSKLAGGAGFVFGGFGGCLAGYTITNDDINDIRNKAKKWEKGFRDDMNSSQESKPGSSINIPPPPPPKDRSR